MGYVKGEKSMMGMLGGVDIFFGEEGEGEGVFVRGECLHNY